MELNLLTLFLLIWSVLGVFIVDTLYFLFDKFLIRVSYRKRTFLANFLSGPIVWIVSSYVWIRK